jgi:hypothetical protein
MAAVSSCLTDFWASLLAATVCGRSPGGQWLHNTYSKFQGGSAKDGLGNEDMRESCGWCFGSRSEAECQCMGVGSHLSHPSSATVPSIHNSFPLCLHAP